MTHFSFPDLPVADALPALLAALADGLNAVLVAPPGAGKTTLVPLHLLRAPWRGDQRIVMLEPRRLAARAAATRMASLLGEAVGETVGYRTRMESAVSARTRIEVVTEGILVRRLQSDPGLDGVAAVIFDEVHERALEGDLALAFCLDLQRALRPEFRLLAMSATPDTARLVALLAAALIESPGKIFPVVVRHAGRDLASVRDLPEAMARAVRMALAEHEGDILAFLPGMGDIRRTQAALDRCGALVLPLHGDLPVAEQDLALRPADGRRVVLATSIAETSLTVPGVRIVIDGGWRRAPRLDAATGLTRLSTLRISRAAAEQRSGRAGREAPGVAIRLWSPALHRGLAAQERPEILEAELSSLLLDCAGWGAAPGDLPFADPPPRGPLAAAAVLLRELGALDNDGRITDTGRRMVVLGAHPRLAAMMLAAGSAEEAALAATLAAILEERDMFRGPEAPADIGLRLAALAAGDAAADRGVLGRVRQAAGQYRRRLRLPGGVVPDGDAGMLLAAGFPDRIAQARGEIGAFRLSGGGAGKLPRADKLATARFLVVPALEMKLSARIRLAAPLDPDALPQALAVRVTETVETTLDPTSGALLARRRRRLGTIILSDRIEQADPTDLAGALADTIAGQGLRPLDWTEAARQWQARVAWMRGLETEAWPDLSDAALIATVRDWLAPYLVGCTKLADAGKLELLAILRDRLGREAVARLDRDVPVALALPAGRAVIDYTQPEPVASARAQAFFGLAQTPVLAGGRIKLKLALLSPAQRPVAITADIAGFWKTGWADVLKEMRGRYPRHNWPEDGGKGV
ncbi:MAG: ATP-dependent helicase HrpB [Acetobacteraceae bacterium]|nr:ATP-dependent helicase HrpB [Acetobacteraceae bacterium]